MKTLFAIALAATMISAAPGCATAYPMPAAVIDHAAIAQMDGCATDTECMEQCLQDLRPDDSPEVCDI
jgi:hypothetical protein